MKLYILHAGLTHPSPYFYNLEKSLKKYKDIDITINSDIPNYKPTEKSILYFNRLKRYYDSNDKKSVIDFLKQVDELKEKGWIIAFTLHNFFPIDRKITNNDEQLLKEFIKKVDILFCFSEYMKKKIKEIYNVNAINHSIGYNELDGWFNNYNDLSLNITKKDFVFTFVGNVSKYKMLDKFIEAFNKIKNDNVYFIIAGPSTKNYDLKYNNDHIIRIDNFIGNDQWKYLNSITNIYINSYDLDYENFKYGFFPSNCVQLNHNKKICIAPKHEIIKELLNKNTYLEYKNDTNSIIDVMNYAISNKDKILNMEKNYNSKNYSWDNTVDIIVKAFRSYSNVSHSIISRGTEKDTRKGYMAISKTINGKRCVFDSDHGVTYVNDFKHSLWFKDKYSIYNIAFSRFQLISDIYLSENKITDNIGIIGLGGVGFSLLINLLDRKYKNISLYIKKNDYILDKINMIQKHYNITLKVFEDLNSISSCDNIFECVGDGKIIGNIINNGYTNKKIYVLGTPRNNNIKIDILKIHRNNLSIIGIHEINGINPQKRQKVFNNILKRNMSKDKFIKNFVNICKYPKKSDKKNNIVEVYEY